MSAVATRTDEEILKVAREHNVGDLAVNNIIGIGREDLLNGKQIKGNIMPGDIVNRAHPEDNYQFAWCPFNDGDFFQDLKDDGYKPVIQSEWLCDRYEWFTPEKQRFRWSVTNMLCMRDEFLMYRNQTLFEQEQQRRAQWNQERIDKRTDEGIEAGLRAGLEVEATVGGKPVKVSEPRRKSVI